jgi:hypothetical protein
LIKKGGARDASCPSRIAVTAPPSCHPSVTEYKYGEVGEIIGKVGKKYLANVLSVLHGIWGEGRLTECSELEGWRRYRRFSSIYRTGKRSSWFPALRQRKSEGWVTINCGVRRSRKAIQFSKAFTATDAGPQNGRANQVESRELDRMGRPSNRRPSWRLPRASHRLKAERPESRRNRAHSRRP